MQRDLFSADVLAFPLARSLEVRRMVLFLLEVRSPRGQDYFTRRCRELSKAMRMAGIGADVMQRQIAEFRDAVEAGLAAATQPQAGAR